MAEKSYYPSLSDTHDETEIKMAEKTAQEYLGPFDNFMENQRLKCVLLRFAMAFHERRRIMASGNNNGTDQAGIEAGA